MKRISQQELRDDLTVVMDAVEGGESFRITRSGTDVADLSPLPAATFIPTVEVVRRLARLPAGNQDRFRTETDEFFGDDHISGE